MVKAALAWMGFLPDPGGSHAGGHSHGHGGHGHGHGDGEHGHTHGVIDATIASTAEGLWAIKWSFVILMATTALQIAAVLLTGSVALLADTVHNFGDASTAIPLAIAFWFARRPASPTFNYGLNRVEDLAGAVVVGLILFSAVYAGYASVERLLHPRPVLYLGALTLAGIIGFLGNEGVAIFRIQVGRRIQSAALIADGYHARVDGFGSLAVVVGALGVWAGFPLADPLVGLVITVLIFGIVWQSARAVFTRMLDGVEPGVLAEIEHTAEHVPGIIKVVSVKARWLGHKLRAEVDLAVDSGLSVVDSDQVATAFEVELLDHMPALQAAHVRIRPFGA